jgi:hypothetical protein
LRQLVPILIPFRDLGTYDLHVHSLDSKGECSPVGTPFNCAIRNRSEQFSERIEIHPQEELHTNRGMLHEECPLLRYDEYGMWAWFEKKSIWWPLRRIDVRLGLDRDQYPRLIWED